MDIDAIAAGGGDRLSRLTDAVLGHILSFLPAPQAARAAALSRRWRHVFAAVHTLSFDEANGPSADGDDNDDDAYSMWSSDYYSYSPAPPPPRSVPAPPFATGVLAALLGRHRGTTRAPLQAIRVKFYEFSEAASARAVDALVSYALLDAGDELRHVDLRFGGGPICSREYSLRRNGGAANSSPPATNDYIVPTSLFSCAVLRTLCLGPCTLSLPSTITLPSLETLLLNRVTDTAAGSNIQRLVSACPRLADLSLKACRPLTALSIILGTRLRSLTLKCCHDLASITVDSSELQTFKYRGALPTPSFLTMHGARRVSWCALDFCGDEASDTELPALAAFLRLFASTKYLRLKSARLGCSIGHDIFSSIHGFPALSHIEITGMLPDGDIAVVATMARILEWSPRLETVTLFFLPELEEIDEENQYKYYNDEDEVHDAHKLSYRYVDLPVPEGALIRCLRERTREINFVHYQGAMAQRMVAKFLLVNAPVVDEVCCEFATGPLFIQTRLMEEIREWTVNKSANMMFF